MPRIYTCTICGEAIPSAPDGTILSYRHWLECSYNARKAAYETLNAPIPATANAGYGLRLVQATINRPEARAEVAS